MKPAWLALAGGLALGVLSTPASGEELPRPRLFLSCATECFEDYLKQELSYFDFVRDRHQADLLIQIVRQPSGNGGERFTIVAIPRKATDAETSEHGKEFLARPGAPPHEVRQLLLQTILQRLLHELAATPHADRFELRLPQRSSSSLDSVPDPWDYWVFAPEVRAEGDATSQFYWLELGGGATVRRITTDHKLRLRTQYQRVLTRYVLEDGEELRGDVYGWQSQGVYAYSLGRHWGAGAITTGRINQFENLRGQVRGGPLLEYNLFPYSENTRKQLRFAYQAGAWANWYFEPNVAGLSQETRPYHALSVVFDFNQKWGSFQAVLQGNAFLDDSTLFRLSSGAIFNVQLVEGLSAQFEGQAAYVKDQISLRARPLTDRELLLWTSQQPTEFLAKFSLGMTYTWGSIHNTIVNPRFGRVDVEEE